ncbi:MAG TPA: hypothetical protein VGJ57_00230 [Nitrospirales bacterium]|jgi:hypothetical protein
MRRCKRCLLSDIPPGANFETDGICEVFRNRRPVNCLPTEGVRAFADFMIRHKILFGRNNVVQLRWLGLRDGDFRTMRPRAAYGPPLL